MGSEQSTEKETGDVDTEIEKQNGLPKEINVKQRLEASTQTDPIEEAGFDMQIPRRQRKLFGVVAVVGKRGESSPVPKSEDVVLSKRCACVRGLLCRVRRCCFACKWLDNI